MPVGKIAYGNHKTTLRNKFSTIFIIINISDADAVRFKNEKTNRNWKHMNRRFCLKKTIFGFEKN